MERSVIAVSTLTSTLRITSQHLKHSTLCLNQIYEINYSAVDPVADFHQQCNAIATNYAVP